MTGQVQALLVDLDGTLADTASANYAAYSAALAEYGVNVDRARFDAMAGGRNWRQFLPEMLGSKAVRASEVAERKRLLYNDFLADISINFGLVEILETFKGAGKPAALVTTASRAAVDAILTTHGLGRFFQTAITGDDVSKHKPDPEPYLLGAAALNLSPAACLAIEDTEIGAQSARSAGCRVLMVSI